MRFSFSFESSCCNPLSLSSTAGREVVEGWIMSAAEEVVGLVYVAFIDSLSYQGTGSTEAMLASLSLARGSTSAAKHSPGRCPLHQQPSDTGVGQPQEQLCLLTCSSGQQSDCLSQALVVSVNRACLWVYFS